MSGTVTELGPGADTARFRVGQKVVVYVFFTSNRYLGDSAHHQLLSENRCCRAESPPARFALKAPGIYAAMRLSM